MHNGGKEETMADYPTTLSATDATGPALSTATRADEEEGFPSTLSEASDAESDDDDDDGGLG